MVTAWLYADEDESTDEFVERLLDGDGVKGVGGFSLVCGKLRKSYDGSEPLAIISNRHDSKEAVPRIADRRGQVHGLSNTSYGDPVAWPKVQMGKEMLEQIVREAVESGAEEEELVKKFWQILDRDTLPPQNGQSFDDYLYQLRKSIFIPPIGGDISQDLKAEDIASAGTGMNGHADKRETKNKLSSDQGIYGTQRQTIILVDHDGNVSFRERSLWDDQGKPIPRGDGDVKFEFQVEGWAGA